MEILHEQLAGKYNNIYLICPTWKSQECYKNLKIAEDHKYDKATNEVFDEIIEKIENSNKKSPNYKHLIILDDWLYSELSRGNSSLVNNILHLRHKKTSIIILSQLYKAVPVAVRVNCNKIVLFKFDSKLEERKLQEEFGDQFIEAYHDFTNKKYGYVFGDFEINILDGRYFDKVKI